MSMVSRALSPLHSTTDGTSFVTGSLTPAAGERLYVFAVVAHGSDVSGLTHTLTDGQGLNAVAGSWDLAGAALGTTRYMRLYEAEFTALARAMTITAGISSSVGGMNVVPVAVTGMPKVRQYKTASGSATNPTVVFDQPVAAGSTVLAVCMQPASAFSLTSPAGCAVLNSGGFATPASSTQVVSWDNGALSGDTVAWQSAPAGAWQVIAVELEAGAASDMSHFIQYGADSTYNVLRIQYPSADPNNITAGGTSHPYVFSCPSNQWGSSTDRHPTDNALTAARTLGAATVFANYRKQPSSVYDTQIRDVHSALQWVIANASTYQLDTTRVGAFGISAGAHLVATAALTGGESNVGGTSTPVGHIRHVLWHFGHNRPRLVDPAYVEIGISRGITNACDGGGGSIEAIMLGGIPCSLASFDWLSGDGGSLSTAKTAVYNKFTPGFWAGLWAGADHERPSFELWHGDADTSIPVFCTHNPKSSGSGHALDNGLHEDLVAGGFTSQYTILAGEGHGGNAFQPSLNASATNGAAVDASVQRLVDAMVEPAPSIGLSPTSRNFNATEGGANPASNTVAVSNVGGGTLSGLGATINYLSGAGWLQATLNQTTAPATLTLQPLTGSLVAGTYQAEVEIDSAAADNGPQTVTVTFTVSAAGSYPDYASAVETDVVRYRFKRAAPADTERWSRWKRHLRELFGL